jgi:hypothetical protein
MLDVEKETVPDLLTDRPYSDQRRKELTDELIQVISRDETQLNRRELQRLTALLGPANLASNMPISKKLAPLQ